METTRPNTLQILELMNGYRASCVVGAAAELDVWSVLAGDCPNFRPSENGAVPLGVTVEQITARLNADLRATTMLLDALAALKLLDKQDDRYVVPPELIDLLTRDGPRTILPMLQHSMNCLRSWQQLAWVVQSGAPGPRQVSIRGAEADRAAFIAAMHSISAPVADDLVARLGPPQFRHLLDVGGASGTWTLAFLRAVPGATATIFDLPDAIEQARERIGDCPNFRPSGNGTVPLASTSVGAAVALPPPAAAQGGGSATATPTTSSTPTASATPLPTIHHPLATPALAARVTLVAGDFYVDDLPRGADYAWVSAIAHQHSRQHNRALYAKVFAALVPGGRIAIRDIVMEPCRTQPVDGALFAVNMLANTETGGTFTFAEFAEDLQSAGFIEPVLRIKDPWMNSVVEAKKPPA
jgi:hypothetical protein